MYLCGTTLGRLFIAAEGLDADDGLDVRDVHQPIPVVAGMGGMENHVGNDIRQVVGHHNFNFDLGHELDSPLALVRVLFHPLMAHPPAIRDGHPVELLDPQQGFFHLDQHERLDDGLHFLHPRTSLYWVCFSSNQPYTLGRTTSVSRVEVTNPPITTAASGRWTSEPMPVASSNGISPRTARLAVINTGRSRCSHPVSRASSSGKPSRRSLLM